MSWGHGGGAFGRGSVVAGPRRRGERGETLIEIVLTVFIIAVALSAIVLGIFTMIRTSSQHRRAVRASNEAMSIAEKIDGASYVKITAAGECTKANPYYPPSGYTAPSNMTVTVTRRNLQDRTANPPVYGDSCPSADQGAQELTVTVRHADSKGSATEKVTIVKREP
jgi:type II secretory pathway pseudopilin PulG